MSSGLAVLPMYDWPEVRTETDALWQLLRDDFRQAGIAAPGELDRQTDSMTAWTSPDLVLGQTCGLPFSRYLRDKVQLIGTPDYALEDCAPGYYRSAWVVRAEDERSGLDAFADGVFAFNSTDSQSGHAVAEGLVFRQRIATGAHAASVEHVASGLADIAAVDAVSWLLAERYHGCVQALRVLAWTDPTPGLPLICGQNQPVGPIREIVAARFAELPKSISTALGIRGLVPSLDYPSTLGH